MTHDEPASAGVLPSAPDGSAFAQFFAGMEGIGAEYAGAISGGTGGKWYCPIPGHDDEHASFDVHVGTGDKAGKVIFTCTPCRDAMGQDECYAAMRRLGVQFLGDPCSPDEVDFGPAADLTKPGRSGKKRVSNWKPIATYRYNHFDASPNFIVERLEDADWVLGGEGCGPKPEKTFRPKRYIDGKGFKGGSGALDHVVRTPLHWELFEDWAETGKHIYLVEGEKACEALVAAGGRATCFHGGTAGKRMDDWALEFKRFSPAKGPAVWVWTDLDEAGLKWAVEVRDELKAVGVKAEIYCNVEGAGWVPKGDAVEHLAAVGPVKPRRVTKELAEAIKALHPMPERTVARGIARGLKVIRTMGVKVPVAPTGKFEGMIPFDPNKSPRPAAAWFLDKKGYLTDTELRLRAVSGEFFLWRGDRYSKIEDAVLAEQVADYFDQRERPPADATLNEGITIDVKKNTRGEVLAALDGLCMSATGGSDDSELRPLLSGEGGVPFRNGWLDFASSTFTPHTSDRFTTWVVPGEYTEGRWRRKDTPLWSEFLDSIGYVEGCDNYRILRQWFGYVLAGLTNVDKAMILYGVRRGGKGTILHVLSRLVGAGHAAMTMDALVTQFGMQQLIGKSLVTVDDAKWDNYNDKVMERLLTLTAFGEVPVDAKYKVARTMRLGARWTFATNDLPRFRAANNALAGRFLVLEFEQSFYGSEDLTLKDRLMAELPGIAKWALDGLADLVDNGGRFTVSEAQRTIEDIMERESSQVRSFLHECAHYGDGTIDTKYRTGQMEAFQKFQTWAATSGIRNPNDKRLFLAEMRTALPGSVLAKSSMQLANKKVTRGWSGLRLEMPHE